MKIYAYFISMCAILMHGHSVMADTERDLSSIMKEEGLTGISWMMITPEQGTRIGSFGMRDSLDPTVPFTPDMQFHVGSVVKTVLATGVLMLATEGKVDLDESIKTYLPDLRIDNPWKDSDPVTMRMLLDHTAGIEDARFWQLFSEHARPNTPLAETIPSEGLMVRTRPGRHFSYSNTGYTVAAMIIEAITGSMYEEYLDKHLLAPLGMHDSTFAFTTQEGTHASKKLVWGHFDDGTRTAAANIHVRPSGQFTTTAADLATFAKFLLSDGKGIIDLSLMNDRGRASTTNAFKHGLPAGYGLGVARRDRHGSIGYCHTGSIIGFYAIFCVYPEEQKAFAYSVNTDSETADYSRLTAVLINELKLNGPPATDAVGLPDNFDQLTGFYRINPTRFDQFRYVDTVLGMRWVWTATNAESLVFGGVQADNRILWHVGENLFRAADRSTPSHVFYQSAHGTTVLDEGFMSYEKVSPLFAISHFLLLGIGLLGGVIIFGSGLVRIVRRQWSANVMPAFVGVVALGMPVPLFFLQSFMALGDLTFASAAVALTTAALPLFMLLTIYRILKAPETDSDFVILGSTVFVCLWWGTMIGYGQMPFVFWS